MTRGVERKAMLTICVSLILVIGGCRTQSPAYVEIEKSPSPQDTKTKITKERAVEIAKEDAQQTYDSLEAFNIVTCETARVWLIIFDGGGPEYVISKESGIVLGRKKIPQGPDVNHQAASSSHMITEQEAIEIAKRQIYADYGETMDEYNVFACELAKAWSVGFEYREVPGELLPHSRSPFYVIDKKTGRVIYREG